jgi:hypothetical protein
MAPRGAAGNRGKGALHQAKGVEMTETLYAEHVNYWKTSRLADAAIHEAKRHIADVGGQVTDEAFIRSGG